MRIDADNIPYRELNERIHGALTDGAGEIILENVRGQRYIGAALESGAHITIEGVPGNDLGAFMNGAEVTVNGNVQDAVGNTMNAGKIVVHGDAGDILGYSMRGGTIFVGGSVGYRAGIHMKAYKDRHPTVVVGGRAGDYLGEYMAGGALVVLGMHSSDRPPVGEWIGTGMHGGVMYLRCRPEPHQLGAEVGLGELEDEDWSRLEGILSQYCRELDLTGVRFSPEDFVKLYPRTARPYGTLYAY